ncbi:MAG: RNA-binding S4 domain-containing protein [Prevotellaceae bacterium]|jgi:23S rRNA pseudouridine2605 synthase|nr:RNA-binding S4 domain-containing protein [Prevotellaceae bacterium]
MKTTHPKNSRNRLDRKENRPPRAGRPKKDGERAPYRSSRSKRDEEEKPFRSPRPDRSEERRERKPSRVKDADKPVRKRAGLTRKDAKPLRKEAKPLRKDAKPLRKDTKPAPKAPKPVKEEVRLNRFIANSGICSRREADTYITAGLVSVNGEVVTELGVKVKPDDEVRFNGERLKGERKVYIVMNKPKDYVTTTADPHAGNMVTDLISSQRCPQRVFPVGRLDRDTTGVLLFTNDGDFAERLSHPSHNQKKIYHVFLGRKLRPQDLRKLVDGIALDDGMAHADLAFYVGSDHTEVGLEIHSGRNRVVRRMFERMGYKIKKLDRVSFAGISKQSLKRGQWRYLNDHEVAMLRMSTHL